MEKESVKYVLEELAKRPFPATRPRQLQVPTSTGKVVALVGVRRSGKTFLMFETMQRLLRAGVTRDRIIYLNLEDDRFYPATARELDFILRAHSELHPSAQRPLYLFLDEVQVVPGWERFVRRVYDSGDVHVFVTGSSSAALTREVAPALRGRSISLEVFPLSFAEYLSFRGIAFAPYDREVEGRIIHALEEYVTWGGLPELALADAAIKPLIIEEYAAMIFHRDLVDRYRIRNEKVMRLLLKHCFSRPASLLSVHRLHRDLASLGVRASKNTLYQYLESLEDAMVVLQSRKHERSLRKQEQNPRKIHPIDPALTQAFTGRPEQDRGHRLENVIFLHERRRSRHVYYHSNAHEIDVIREGPDLHVVNVCWSLGDVDALRREEAALDAAAKRYPDVPVTLVAHEIGALASSSRHARRVRTAWRYLLDLEEPPAGGNAR